MRYLRNLSTFAWMLVAAMPAAQAQDLTNVTLEQVRQGAQNGAAIAQVELAERLMAGNGVLQSRAKAAEWYLKAATGGDATAQNAIGKLYHAGLGVERDLSAALRWLEAATVTNDPQFLFDYATVLETAEGDGNATRAADLYGRAANAGHVEAAVNLGVLYQNGTGVAQDADRARGLFAAAAETGNARAQNNLGLFYVRGDGVTQDYPRAAALFGQAAEQGLTTAMTNLGVMYENGYGVPLDEERAAQLYRLAGAGATPETPQFIYDPRLAPLTLTKEVIEALNKAADADDPVAMFQLGWAMIRQDNANFASVQRAATLFRKSAEAGYGPAMANLGLMHFNGQGVPQDYVLGHMWILLANRAGVDTDAISIGLSEKLTAQQANLAETLASDRITPPAQ